jgi:DNA-binding MarR family transcriptional regulator
MARWQDFGSAARRQIGLLLREGPRTQAALALAMGRSTPSIAKLVQRMYADGLVVATPDPPTRGTVYSLSPSAERALDEALTRPATRAGGSPAGRLDHQGWMLVVEGNEDVTSLSRILSDPDLTADVAWAAETDTLGGMLLAMTPGTPAPSVHALYGALTRAGIRCIRVHHTGEVHSGEAMRESARRVVAAIEAAG